LPVIYPGPGGAGAASDEPHDVDNADNRPPVKVILPDEDGASAHAPRLLLLDVLRRRQHRVAQCRSVPISVLVYIMYIVAMMMHVSIGDSFSFETGCVAPATSLCCLLSSIPKRADCGKGNRREQLLGSVWKPPAEQLSLPSEGL
jgi:hypothetical protein